ncbi:thermonuclease family protein [Mesobacillus subterraneus]|uniref:Nuclease n=1 Tax=Mesobacillus subterraneus TaxID=285983 RepID=A0A427TW06_9BACI|nr:thermonuclease family protein [Mesobacillus subterraneus]RSD28582.1 nuclease [Mesobacillus subterraneus]
MRIIKLILMVAVLLLMLILSIAAPIALIGVAIFAVGMWLSNQKYKGKSYKEKPWMFLTAGFITTFVLFGIFVEDVPEDTASDVKTEQQAKKEAEKIKNEQIEKEKKEKELAEQKAKEEAEEKAKLEAEEKAKAEAEAKAKAEEEAKAKAEAEQKASEEALISSLGLESVTVGRVVDGDTIETTDGRKIRLIGVNTPESTTRKETYGKEASNYTTSKLNGKKVWMQKDVSDTDRYDRQLRIIWLAIPTDDMNESEIRSKMFNAELVLNGYAEPSTFPPDVKYSEYFTKFAREAREAGTGLWAFGVNGTTKGDLDPKETAQKPASTSTSKPASTTTSKPAASTSQPAPSTSAPASSGQTENFANCTELRKVYPNGVPSTHPAYQSKMDRDKDNFACER